MKKINNLIGILLLLYSFFNSIDLKAEGTKEISPEADRAAFVLSREYSDFGLYGAKDSEKIKITINSGDEKIYLGLNNQKDNWVFVPGVAYRIVSPSGKIIFSSIMKKTGLGTIDTWEQAVAGPKSLGNPDGYDAHEISVEEPGDYILEFDTTHAGYYAENRLNINYLDVTVADANKKVVNGRLHSQGWQISTRGWRGEFKGKVYPYDGGSKYPYTDGSAVYEVDLNGIQPYLFIINFNSKGVTNGASDDPFVARQSKVGKFISPEFEVFLNPPDENIFAVNKKEIKISGKAKRITCSQTEFCFTSNNKGFLEGYLDFNDNNQFDATEGEVYFAKELDGVNENCITWNGKDKNGKTVKNSEFKILSKVGFGVTHLPLYDVEVNKGGYKVKVIRPAGSPPPDLFWDDSNIKAGQPLGGNLVNLEGCSPSSNGCHRWSGRGDSLQIDKSSEETINTWWYSTVVLDTMVYNKNNQGKVTLSYQPGEVDKRDSTVCKGDSLKFFIFNDGKDHFNATRYRYEWSVNGKPLPISEKNFQSVKILGKSNIVVNAVDKNGQLCTTSDTIRVSVTDKVSITSYVAKDCIENSGHIKTTIITGNKNVKFYWKEFPDETTGELKGLSPGTYHLNVKDPIYPQCGADTSLTIASGIPIEIDTIITSPFDCAGFDGTAVATMTNPSGNFEYSWDKAPFNNDHNINTLKPGIHFLTVRDKVSHCSVTNEFDIPFKNFILTSKVSNEICSNKNGSIELFIDLTPGASILWGGKQTNEKLKSNLGNGNYSISVVSSRSQYCNIDTNIFVGNNDANLKAEFLIDKDFSKDSVLVGDSILFTNHSGKSSSTLWDFGDGTLTSTYHAKHSYKSKGKYDVSLTIKDDFGCMDKIIKPIIILEGPPCGVVLPNAFSPNLDNINELIGPMGLAPKIDLKIFNRWGEVIFRSESINDKWNGIYRDEESPIGVYPYILDFYCPGSDGKLIKETKVGEITLVR